MVCDVSHQDEAGDKLLCSVGIGDFGEEVNVLVLF